MVLYGAVFGVCVAVFVAVLFLNSGKRRRTMPIMNAEFNRFQTNFLIVFLTMFGGDWLQGPTVYALYEYYGFSRATNGVLFIVGFGSSLLFGPFAGSLADRYGRRRICIAYGVIYSLCCLTKHVRDLRVLLLGRVFGGIATSIVWSGFEAWMVAEHKRRGFADAWLEDTFAKMTVGNGLIAIPSGIVAQMAMWLSGGHPVAPFDVALGLLLVGTAMVLLTWKEVVGASDRTAGQGLVAAVRCVWREPNVGRLGAVQALYEGAMYIFIFIWTPALEAEGPIPHGIIFASFMVCCSVGGLLFTALRSRLHVQAILPAVLAGSALCCVVPTISGNSAVLMPAFCAYETLIGVFWPAIAMLRSAIIPETHRTTVMNLYRVPLNFLVIAVLVFQGSMTVPQVFKVCVGLQLLSLLAVARLPRLPRGVLSDSPSSAEAA